MNELEEAISRYENIVEVLEEHIEHGYANRKPVGYFEDALVDNKKVLGYLIELQTYKLSEKEK